MPAKHSRKTKETRVDVELDLNGGDIRIATPIKFLTHMLESLAKHARLGLAVSAESRDGDEHHVAEDVAITLGQALRSAVGSRPIQRFAHEVLPMDDALVGVYLDAGGRSYYEGKLPNPLYEHFLRSLAHEAGLTLHVNVMRGRDEHHVTEAAFKALARCLRRALAPADAVASTKGTVEMRGG